MACFAPRRSAARRAPPSSGLGRKTRAGALRVQENVPLWHHCSFGIGGPARWFARCGSVEDLRQAAEFARDMELLPHSAPSARPSSRQTKKAKVLVLGKGSNVLFDDRGYDGLVILNECDFCDAIPVAS